MSDFFGGWRRKMGIVTLALALASIGLWGLGQTRKSPVDVRIPVGEDVEYGVRLTPVLIHILKYQSFQYHSQRATGALTIEKVPYWSIVTPLTLLSAYLLLTRPRERTTKQSSNDGD